jgi:hypothetical protein
MGCNPTGQILWGNIQTQVHSIAASSSSSGTVAKLKLKPSSSYYAELWKTKGAV